MSIDKRPRPNFFIIGAPKSGTTALSEYLRQHPDVLFSQPKEPHFFNDDFSHRHIESMDAYLDCFSHGGGDEVAIGEGSVFYLYSRTAVPNIVAHWPDARFIVMLRNPLESAYSWHWQALYSFGEDLVNFEQAWRAQGDRLAGRQLPRDNRVREALHYGPLFRYAEQLERLFRSVPAEQVKIVLFDDFKSDTGRAYQDILAFLNLPLMELSHYEVINPSKRIRYPVLERTIRLGVAIKRFIGIEEQGLGIATRLKRWNTRYEKRPPLTETFREELLDYYRDDIRRTAALIGHDLDNWLNG